MEDKQLFDMLFRTYYEPLFYFARQYVLDDDDCHDIVEGAFEQLWSLHGDVHPDTVRALLYTQVRNRCIDHLRHQQQRQRYANFVAHHSEQYIDERAYDLQADRERIVKYVLDTIGEPTRSILLASYVDGKKYKEVAEMMGISVSTVKKHMVKALKTIREMRKKHHW